MKSKMQDVQKAMRETEVKCPYCGGTRFVMRETTIVQFFEDEHGCVRTELVRQLWAEDRLACDTCGEDLTDVELGRGE